MDKFLIPLSIVLAGFIVAGSVLVAGGKINFPFDAGIKKNDAAVSGNNVPPVPPSPGAPQNPPPLAEPINVELGSNPVQGSKSAKVAVVEFGDFQCPYCSKFNSEVLPKLETDYISKGLVKFAYRDLAFLGTESKDAALAARCAGEQGKFWEYHDKLFNSQSGENQGAFKVTNLKSFAKVLGLSTAQFNACFDARKYDGPVASDMSAAATYKVNSTPTVFINGRLFDSRFGYDNFYTTIDAELKKQ